MTCPRVTSRAHVPARVTALALLATLLAAAPAHAQTDTDKATARGLGQQGASALSAGDWATAAEDFRRADALYHAPSLTLGLARAQSHLGLFVQAWENYHQVIAENVTTSPGFSKALRDAKAEIAAVDSRRSRVTIRVTGADAPRVSVDGVPLKAEALGIERFVNPGHYVVTVTADGWKTVTRPVDVAEGQGMLAWIAMERDTTAAVVPALLAPVPLPSPQVPAVPSATETSVPQALASDAPARPLGKTLGFAALGVGGAGVLVGAITGGLALSDHSKLSAPCASGTCPASSQSDLSAYHTMGTVSTIGFVVGGLGVAGGVVLLLTAPKSVKAPSAAQLTTATVYVGLGTAGAAGTF